MTDENGFFVGHLRNLSDMTGCPTDIRIDCDINKKGAKIGERQNRCQDDTPIIGSCSILVSPSWVFLAV